MKRWFGRVAALALVLVLSLAPLANAAGLNLLGYSDRMLYMLREFGVGATQATVASTAAQGASTVLVAAQGAGTKILVLDVQCSNTDNTAITGPIPFAYRSGTTVKLRSFAPDEAVNSVYMDPGRRCNILCADNETFNILNTNTTANAMAHSFFVTYVVLDATVH